jgi:MATE family multidrug resistance protein
MCSWQGIWTGMLGGTCMQTLILFWITFRTDWNKEVYFFDEDCRLVQNLKLGNG